jgi:hypothetical protein
VAAGTVPVNRVVSAVPWAVDAAAYETGVDVTLSFNGGKGSKSNLQALALGGSGKDHYRDMLEAGYPGWLRAGDDLSGSLEPGTLSGPTRDGVEYRIAAATSDARCAGDTPASYHNSNPRIVLVAMVDSTGHGRGGKTIRITGFAAFYLIGMQGSDVAGRFVRVVDPSGETDPTLPPAADFQVRNARLVE